MLNIAIDYDGTWTKFSASLRPFVLWHIAQGNAVHIVTRRRKETESIVFPPSYITSVIYCDRRYKKHVTDSLGLKIDLWIDDEPGTIEEGKILADSIDDDL